MSAQTHIENALYGEPLDKVGNRDENGLTGYPDYHYVLQEVRKAHELMLEAQIDYEKLLRRYVDS